MAGVLFENRARAESFGAIAELYDRARPSYPPALVDALLSAGARSVVDVGCGTGIAATLLTARGCDVLGVEIDERMAEVARAKGLEVEVARFEDWDDRGRRFDLLASGQAWHWIDPAAGTAKAAAILHEGGRLGLFWNLGDPPEHVRARLAAIYERLEPGLREYTALPDKHLHRTDETLAALAAAEWFAPAEVARFKWSEAYDTAGWVERVSTKSDHQVLPADRRERLLVAIGEAIDALGGSFVMAQETVLVSAQRLPDAGA
jgi:SAM-dependent methyltransferase